LLGQICRERRKKLRQLAVHSQQIIPPENYVIGAISHSLKFMTGWVLRWLSIVRTRLRQRLDRGMQFIVLRHQLAVLQRTGTRRPRFRPSERPFSVFLSRWWANWLRSPIIVQPATVLRWRRRGSWGNLGIRSCGRRRGGRPRISGEVRALIVRMRQENGPCAFGVEEGCPDSARRPGSRLRRIQFPKVTAERLVGSIRRDCLDHVVASSSPAQLLSKKYYKECSACQS
jgi:hypothetical protein